MPDAKKEAVIRDIKASAFGMSGQRCMAVSVVLAVGNTDHIIKELVDSTKNMVAGIDLPHLISKDAVNKMHNYLAESESKGADILVDGRNFEIGNNKHLIGPSIIDWSKEPNKMSSEEVFGPILEIKRVKTLEEALSIQNTSPYGNGASILTQNGRLAGDAIQKLKAGMLGINIGIPVPREPFSFGGLAHSKFGHGDITGKSSLSFWSNLIKVSTKWNVEDKNDWMS